MVPRDKAPLDQPVTIYWDDHQIPFIEAATDPDAATALGIVHAQLRLGQIELLRRLAQGRLAEMIGSTGVEIDRQLRTLDPGRAVPGMLAMMPARTRDWLDAFARGITHHLMRTPRLPPEFSLFALQREPWTTPDVLTVGRLMSADVNWLVWLRLLQFHDDPDWPILWRKLAETDSLSFDSAELLAAPIRSGSNSLVIGPGRTQSGAPIIASDPHLPLVLPNPWLIAALKSPSYNVVGLMLPGLPFVALGRNPSIAWGGTSLHAASSDVIAVEASDIEQTTQQIKVRWGRPRTVCVNVSRWGPVMTDTMALRWMGHKPSDEVTAMLAVNRARNWEEYRTALDGFSVPGQNMLYADTARHIGKVMAVHLPRRAKFPSDDLVLSPDLEQGWDDAVTGTDLPYEFDPMSGFIASANERPPECSVFIGHQFSRPDRRRRLDHLLSATEDATVTRAIEIQRDVYWAHGVAQCQQLLRWMPPSPAGRQQQLINVLASWDGNYDANSRGALAFELLSNALAHQLVSKRRLTAYSLAWGTRRLVWSEIVATPPEPRQHALRIALRRVAKSLDPRATWGSRHRLRLGHPLNALPVIGRRWRFTDLPVGGGNDTLMKTAHGLTDRIHGCSYGSTARHISDLSDQDLNLFALAGGQDGWPGSTTFIDQVRPFLRSDYVTVPLRAETARATFPHRMDITP
jgi:penicillin G amidase